MKRKKVRIDLAAVKEHMAEQVSFLRSSARSFDAGVQSEAKRLALTLRVLLHDTDYSKSLLSQYGSAFKWRFADTATPFSPENMMSHQGLVVVRLTSGPDAGARQKEEIAVFARPWLVPSASQRAWN